jgi:hypothetical protein
MSPTPTTFIHSCFEFRTCDPHPYVSNYYHTHLHLPRCRRLPYPTDGLAPPTHTVRNPGTAKPGITRRNSEHSAITDNIDRWATRLRPPFLCDFSTPFPSRAFEQLREGELFLRQVELGSYLLCDSIPGAPKAARRERRKGNDERMRRGRHFSEKVGGMGGGGQPGTGERQNYNSQFYDCHRAPLHYGRV